MHKKKYFEEKNGWKSCLQGELNPGLLRDRPSSWPLDQVVTNEIEKKKSCEVFDIGSFILGGKFKFWISSKIKAFVHLFVAK